jgi:hypothetical protein
MLAMQKLAEFPQSALLAALLLAVIAAAPTPVHAATYAGSDSCQSCHEKEYSLWKSSHHYQAMQVASDETVLGNFSDSEFEYAGIHSRFYKKDGKFFVETDNENGELQEFEISYTFGFYPLQQYLVPFPNGRKQKAANAGFTSTPMKRFRIKMACTGQARSRIGTAAALPATQPA